MGGARSEQQHRRSSSYVSLISPTTKIERLSLAARRSSPQTKMVSLISSDSSHGEVDGWESKTLQTLL